MIGISAAVMRGAGGDLGYVFYRLSISASHPSNQNLAIFQLALITPSNPSGVPSGGTATANAHFTGYGPEEAFVAGVGSRWWASSADRPWWLQYEFPKPAALTAYAIQSYALSAASPTDFTFSGSHDGITWETLDSQAGQAWTPNETKEFPL